MSCRCGKVLSDKDKISHVFNKNSETTDKKCCSENRLTADCKRFNHYKTDGQHKMKRLKTRKERSQMRGGGKEASKTKLHPHHCCHQSSKDMAHFHNSCHSSCHRPLRRDPQFLNVVPAAQEPSIITHSRLIGHHGLFNHEVKSVDIERLLNQQGRLEKSGQKAQQKKHVFSHPSSASHIPSPLSINDLLCADTGEILPLEREADPATNAGDDNLEREKNISLGSDETPVQRPQQQLYFSPGSYKSIFSSKHSSPDVVIINSNKDRVSQLTPTAGRDNVKMLNKNVKQTMISTPEPTPKNHECPAPRTQDHGLSPRPLQLSSSPTADSFEIQHGSQDPGCVSECVSKIAARLCDGLQFPVLRRRNLVAESREVLLKALRERHGPQLQENLTVERQCFGFGTDLKKEVHDHHQEPTIINEDELLPADDSTFQADTVSQACFDVQKTTSFKMLGSRHYNWKSTLQPYKSLEQTAEWLTRRVGFPATLLDDVFRPSGSPQSCMDFPPASSASDHLFATSPTSCWREKASASQHWEDSLSRPKSKKSVMFDPFENSIRNHMIAGREKSCEPQYNDGNIQPFFPYQTQLPDRYAVEPRYFPQEQPFETNKYSSAPSLSPQIYHSNQSHRFQPSRQFSHPSTCSPLRFHHTDMIHYPPSHMLERGPALPLSSLPSPEHWSFPPMKLY